MAQITEGSVRILRGLASGDPASVGGLVGLDADAGDMTDLGPRVSALIGLAVLVALNGPEAGIRAQVGAAVEAGADVEDIVGVLVAVAPHAGASRVVGAAPQIMRALGVPAEGVPQAHGPSPATGRDERET